MTPTRDSPQSQSSYQRDRRLNFRFQSKVKHCNVNKLLIGIKSHKDSAVNGNKKIAKGALEADAAIT